MVAKRLLGRLPTEIGILSQADKITAWEFQHPCAQLVEIEHELLELSEGAVCRFNTLVQ